MAVQESPKVRDTTDDVVTWSTDERVHVVRMHRPPANALGLPMVEGLQRALDAFDASDAGSL